MGPVLLFVVVGAFVGGFLLAGKWVENIVIQLVLGVFLGVGLLFAVCAALAGVAFAGCLLLSK